VDIERNKNIENGKPKLLSEIYNKINIKLNNKMETRLNTHSNMQMMVSHLSRFLWDNRILSQINK